MPDHVARALRRIAEQPVMSAEPHSVVGQLRRLCGAALLELSACGAGLSVLAGGGQRGITVASDPVSERIEELQLLLGEGPCVDALASRRPVLVGDLDALGMSRWPVYTPALYDDGIRAVFAFPLQVVQLGVTLIEALARIRAFAFAENRRLIDVAHDVVARTVIFEPDR